MLLRDVDTNWSSTFLMIDQVLEFHMVCLPLKIMFSLSNNFARPSRNSWKMRNDPLHTQ